MIVGILLAAGAGTRFGGDKLLARLPDGRGVAETACANLRDGVDHVVAVVRAEHEVLAERLRAAGAEVRCFEQAHLGMGASLAYGVAGAMQADGWLIALADMPMIASADIRRVADALRNGAAIAIPVHEGVRGHPVGFARRFGDELCALHGDSGARQLIERHAGEVSTVPLADDANRQDIDTPQDWARICRAMAPER